MLMAQRVCGGVERVGSQTIAYRHLSMICMQAFAFLCNSGILRKITACKDCTHSKNDIEKGEVREGRKRENC